MRKLFSIFLLSLIMVFPVFGERNWVEVEGPDWSFEGLLTNDDGDTVTVSGVQAVERAKDGRIWMSGLWSGIVVVDEEGNQASFSPIDSVTLADTTFSTHWSQGVVALPDGNMVVMAHNVALKFSYQTGELMANYVIPSHTLYSACPSVDANGYVYIPNVFVNPVIVLDSDLNFVQEITLPNAPVVTRKIIVDPDGLGIWAGNDVCGAPLYRWTSENYIDYVLTDSIFKDTNGDSIFSNQPVYMNWGPDSTFWVSHDDYYAARGKDGIPDNCLISFNFETEEFYRVMMPDTALVHKLGWYYNGPRGCVFSEDGNTMFVPSGNMSWIYVYEKGPSAERNWVEVEGPDWSFEGLLTNDDGDTVTVSGVQAVERAKDGRIWMSGLWSGIVVVDEEGNQASFSPIDSVTLADTTFSTHWSQGVVALPDGNMVVMAHNVALKFSYQTGELMANYVIPSHTLYSACPSVDANGYVYIPNVFVNPVIVLDSDLNFVQEITLPNAPVVTRKIIVDPDGLGIWAGNDVCGAPLYRWTSENYIDYVLTDSIFKDTNGDSIFSNQPVYMNWGPDSTFWVSHDDYYAARGKDGIPDNCLISFDFDTEEFYRVMMPDTAIVHKPGWYYNGPRGCVFSSDGNTMFVPSGNMSWIYVYEKQPVGVEGESIAKLPIAYVLHQNYPNPFNPTTTIPFEVNKFGKVKITVYNMLGREVKVLVDSYMQPGKYKVRFDAQGLSSGFYFYRLKAGDIDLANEMLLIK